MRQYKMPKTLYNLALNAFSEVIATKCVELEVMCKNHQHDLDEITEPLHDTLHAIIPHALCNDVCEAVLARFDRRFDDGRPMEVERNNCVYKVVVNDKLTSLRARGNSTIAAVMGDQYYDDDLYNSAKAIMEKGDISGCNWYFFFSSNEICPSNDKLVFAIGNSCPNLEHIALPFGYTHAEAFSSLINSCPKLRTINCRGNDQSRQMVRLALTKLPDLECLNGCRNIAEILESLGNHGPLKLRYVKVGYPKPANVRATVNLCPHLQELCLNTMDQSDVSEIFGILADSKLKLKKFKFPLLSPWNENAERFFQAKGEHIEHLCFGYCPKSDVLHFENFIRRSCMNLRVLYLLVSRQPTEISSYKFQTTANMEGSFLRLEEFCYEKLDSYNKEEIKGIFKLVGTASSIQKIVLLQSNVYETIDEYEINDIEIAKMFPVENMKELRHFECRGFKMLDRVVGHLLSIAPKLTTCVVSKEYMAQAKELIYETFSEFDSELMMGFH